MDWLCNIIAQQFPRTSLPARAIELIEISRDQRVASASLSTFAAQAEPLTPAMNHRELEDGFNKVAWPVNGETPIPGDMCMLSH